jgi:NAD(P)-dependent dehydrogenase (short-subunit alcohol dehydrogenase family)
MPADQVLRNKVVVVTGGAGLLGSRFCRAIAEHGGVAVVADRDGAAADRVARDIAASGGRAEPASLDISDGVSIDRLLAGLDARHGRVDAVVNNAYPRNRQWGRRLEDVTYADFCENVSMHLGGYFLVAQKFAVYFRTRGGGAIVNMGSIYGSMVPRFEVYAGSTMTMPVEYAAIKSGVLHLTRYFARYFAREGVRCNALSPGGILDAQPEEFRQRYHDHAGTKGLLHPEDVTGSLVFLLSDASRYVTGQNLVVDDGFSL